MRARASALVRVVQERIVGGLEALEEEAGSKARFGADSWERPGGGGGLTRVIEGGAVIEKGGVNVSVVHGAVPPGLSLPGNGDFFFATGVSLVLHPKNPYVPTVHANFRYLEHGDVAWFGGGADLTPSYLDEGDVSAFHGVWQRVCAAHRSVADGPAFRDACDRYFWLPHRGERRGAGGIFFDDLRVGAEGSERNERLLSFVDACGSAFLEAWSPIARRHRDRPYGDGERAWQALRRGRYVEFNLVYDRGTLFGLRTSGRVESILMSLPPHASWGYVAEPAPGTPEAALLAFVRRPPP